MAKLKQKIVKKPANLEKTINVRIENRLTCLSFLEIDKLLDEQIKNKSISIKKSSKTLTLIGKDQIIIKVDNIADFAWNFNHFLNQGYYFSKKSIFKMQAENGQFKIINVD